MESCTLVKKGFTLPSLKSMAQQGWYKSEVPGGISIQGVNHSGMGMPGVEGHICYCPDCGVVTVPHSDWKFCTTPMFIQSEASPYVGGFAVRLEFRMWVDWQCPECGSVYETIKQEYVLQGAHVPNY